MPNGLTHTERLAVWTMLANWRARNYVRAGILCKRMNMAIWFAPWY